MNECLHPTAEFTIRTKSNGATCVTRQCITCGLPLGEVSKIGHVLDRLPPYNETLQDSWREEYCRLNRQQLEAQWKQDKEEWFVHYAAYLNTPHWIQVRHIVLARDRTCQCCFNASAVEAHHLTYDSYNKHGLSFAVECVGVCLDCHHNRLHDAKDQA